jgi:hypothetical protein
LVTSTASRLEPDADRFVAMAIGLLAAIMLGTGLARLVLNDRCGNQ